MLSLATGEQETPAYRAWCGAGDPVPAEGPRWPEAGAVTTRPLPLGRRLIGDIDSVAEALAAAEGEAFR
jgi:hypothetical protein